MSPPETPEYIMERNSRRAAEKPRGSPQYHSQRRTSNRDEFDGPHQLLEPPSAQAIAAQDKELPQLPTNLDASEQYNILHKVNDRLSQCAYDFVAKYQFRVPIEQDKRPVKVPSDRQWTEWVHLLKRLATTRRIPAHLLYNRQIKQLITVLENSLEMRHAAKHQSRPVKDDRNVIQLISAGIQVDKILKDSSAMQFLDCLYVDTEKLILERRGRRITYTMKAYWYDNVQGDQREPHDSGRVVSEDKLASLGVLYVHCSNIEAVDSIAADRGYRNRDQVCVSPATMGDTYEDKVGSFFTEHLHEDEEIRYILDGEGYFDVRGQEDEWIRIALVKDDMIILPAGIYHRFTTNERNYIKAMRLFQDEPKWTPLNRGVDADSNPGRKTYLDAIVSPTAFLS
ncbi:unnamed protein product [Penicillium olsonii]|nr:unnamed protein product [Penicillium olsonii]